MPGPSQTLHLGDVAPDLALQDAISEEMVTLPDLLTDRRGALLVFHRGMW